MEDAPRGNVRLVLEMWGVFGAGMRALHTGAPLCARVVGYRMEWAEIIQRIATEDFDKFGRLEADADVYDRSLAETRRQWVTVADFILNREFRLPVYVDEESGKKYCKSKDDAHLIQLRNDEKSYGGVLQLNGSRVFFSLHENDYAYALEPPIKHYLIWSIPHPLTQTEVQKVLQERYHLSSEEYQIFENPAPLRSIPQIFHFQIFTKSPLPFPYPNNFE